MRSSAAPRLRDTCLALIQRREISASMIDEELINYARSHGLIGVVVREAHSQRLRLPPERQRIVMAAHRAALAHTAMLRLEQHRVLSEGPEFAQPAIVLKGDSIARYYERLEYRPYSDLDVLIPLQDVARWHEHLLRKGFVCLGDPKHFHRYDHELPFVRRVGRAVIRVELHHTLFMAKDTRAFGYDAFNQQSDTVGNVLYPNRVAAGVVIGLHLLHHRRPHRRLIWLADLDAVGPEALAGSQELTSAWGIGWVMETALEEASILLEHAAPHRAAILPGGLPRATQDATWGPIYRLAYMREIGVHGSLRYLSSRLHPRRFGAASSDSFTKWVRRRTPLQRRF